MLLPLGIAGIKPLEKAFDKVVIKPDFTVYNFFKCAVPTPKGDIAVKFENGEFTYYIPDGITAELIINDAGQEISGCGKMSI